MEEKKRIKIILVDDHQIVRDGIKSLLVDHPDIGVCGEASDASALFHLLKTISPDLVLLDISLPTISGIEVSKRLSLEYPKIKKLMLSMYTSEEFVFNAIKSGCHGYLHKNTTRVELLEAINTVFQGREYFSKKVSDIILKSYYNNARQKRKFAGDSIDILTQREYEIMVYVVEGLSNPVIAQKLNLSIRTVETHKTNIMKKLNLHNAVELVKFALKNNIIEL